MKRGFLREHIPLFDSMLIHDQSGQGEGPTLPVESRHTPIASPTTSQPTTSQPMSSQEQPSQVPTTEHIITTSSLPFYETTIPDTTSSMPHDSPLLGVTSLKDDLKQTKKVYGKALTKLVKRVKHLEAKLKSTSVRRKARMVISNGEEDLVSEDPSKQEISRDNLAYSEYGIRLMLAPRLAKALQEKVLSKLHGIRKLPGSPSLGGTLFWIIAELSSLKKATEICSILCLLLMSSLRNFP
ncbi:hypothetical protein Tco_0625723 [Tanacetum coccineum]|uniref:Uncharacterized protein n=1 Tax=Tanacetum coccineum TaxID=301880 RepID=A0ABQ4WHP0_9ASTR